TPPTIKASIKPATSALTPMNPVYSPKPAASLTSPMPKPPRVNTCNTNMSPVYPTEPNKVVSHRPSSPEASAAVTVVASNNTSAQTKNRPVQAFGNRCWRMSIFKSTAAQTINQPSAQPSKISTTGFGASERRYCVISWITYSTLANRDTTG